MKLAIKTNKRLYKERKHACDVAVEECQNACSLSKPNNR